MEPTTQKTATKYVRVPGKSSKRLNKLNGYGAVSDAGKQLTKEEWKNYELMVVFSFCNWNERRVQFSGTVSRHDTENAGR